MSKDRLLAIETPYWDYGSGSLSQIAFVLGWMREAPPADEIRARVQRSVEWCPRLRTRVVDTTMRLTRPRWEPDPEFDLGNHFRHHSLPTGSTREDLYRFLSDIDLRPFDRSRPLWEAWYIDNVDAGAILGVRANHATLDASTGMNWLRVCSDQCPDYDTEMTDVRASVARAAGERQRSAESGKKAGLGTQVADFAKQAGDLFKQRAEPVWPGPISDTRVLTGTVMPLATIKAIRSATTTSPNAVLQTLISMAIESLEPDVPDEISVSMPMTVRALYPRASPLDMNSRQISIPCPIPVHINDPVERLVETNERISSLKLNRHGFLRLAELASFAPRPLLLRATRKKLRQSSMVASAVPGPARMSIAGAPVEDMYLFSALQPCNPLAIGGAVYGDTFTFAVIGDPANFPRTAELPDALQAALDDLHSAATTRVS